ncbi:MAG: DUF1592 domain-containing protein [Verrucomicrobiales bacterium]|nr:DUF1592 domain-containing protein [Verrucomicrobiales bacterium]
MKKGGAFSLREFGLPVAMACFHFRVHLLFSRMVFRLAWILVFSVVCGTLVSAEITEERLNVEFRETIGPLLSTYCFDCHDGEVQKGDLDLTVFDSLSAVQENFKIWQTVLQQVEEEEMPPKKPFLPLHDRADLSGWVRRAIDAIDWSQHREIERLTIPRLTKEEYNNTLRDLLGVDFRPGDRLLDDGQGLSGFTNDRDALFISPALAEQYFQAADETIQAVLDLREGPMERVYEAEEMLMTERSSKPEELPGGGFGYSLAGAGQRTLYDEISLPAGGWYRVTVRSVGLQGDSGMRLRIDNEIRADFLCADDVPGEKTVELLLRAGTHQMTWNIELPRDLRKVQVEVNGKKKPKKKSNRKFTPLPENAGDLVSLACEENTPVFPVPPGAGKEAVAMIRRLNLALGGMQRRLEYLRLVTPEGNPGELRTYYGLLPERTAGMATIKKQLAALLQVKASEIDRRLGEANRDRIASNQKVLADSLAILGVDYDPQFLFGNAPPVLPRKVGSPGVDWIRIEGPILPDGSYAETVASLVREEPAEALQAFLARAFRRPLREGEAERYLGLYENATNRGESHHQALKLAYTAALTSPAFLFRDEMGTDGEEFTLNAHQLASRLSYFLWMSMPDAELRSLADEGRLLDAEVLRSQVQRMIRSPKLRAFSESFLGQWLGFAELGKEHVPDAKKFPEFTASLAAAMKEEPVLFFEAMLREGTPLTEFLNARETFANAELAELYGIPGLEGDDFQKVRLLGDERGGLLGMAAILTTSATPNRTSPVLRGKWVLENFLGRRLEEAPADAGQLDDKAGEDRGKTLREELAEHRRNESCAVCHDRIDPIGFGLENFDAIGRFREKEAGRPVDATGELPGGHVFSGAAELRALLQERHETEFLTNVTRRLTSFALGRALQAPDEGLVREMLVVLAASGNRADSLIEGIVLSDAFRKQGKEVP